MRRLWRGGDCGVESWIKDRRRAATAVMKGATSATPAAGRRGLEGRRGAHAATASTVSREGSEIVSTRDFGSSADGVTSLTCVGFLLGLNRLLIGTNYYD
jgi:hypothetical protein